ncbi:MAG: hypothetical protein JNK82_35885 [Myxococcaceae bacterium]|nr:hypothetical protein [Myxococcaceae bacterium]
MRADVIETRTGRIWLDDEGIVQSMQLDGVEQVLADAEENMAATRRAAGGVRRPMLVDMSRVKSINREARVRYTDGSSAQVVLAVALVIGNPLTRMIGNFFIGMNHAPVPTRLFDSRREALEWLRSKMSPA